MNKLKELGLLEADLENMVNQNPMLSNLSEEEIETNILFLKKIECKERHIRNILIANPFYLSRSLIDLEKLINKLFSLGLNNLNLLFDSNPLFLNHDAFEIDDFIQIKQNEGLSLEDIADLIDSNPYAINEI